MVQLIFMVIGWAGTNLFIASTTVSFVSSPVCDSPGVRYVGLVWL